MPDFLSGLFPRYGGAYSLGSLEQGVRRAIQNTDSGQQVNEFLALNLTSVYSAVNVIANTIAQLPVHVYQKTEDGREPVTQHPVADLLNLQANENLVPYTMKQTKISHGLLWGNGMSEVVRNGRGQAMALEVMEPYNTIQDEPDPGRIVYRYNDNGSEVELPSRDVLHLKALGPNGLAGYSPIQLHRQGLGLALSAEKFGSKFFANDARSGGFIHYPGQLTEGARKNLADSINSKGGTDEAFKAKVLEEGAKYVQTTIPPDDAQFLGTREFQVAEVARMYGVPLILLQSHEKSTSWGSGVEQLILGFVRFTLQPWIVQLEQEMNRKLFTPSERRRGLFVKFALTALLRGDMASRAEFYNNLYNVGAMTPNEIRRLEDMNPVPEGDKTYFPTNMAPADGSGQPADGGNEQ